MARLGTRTATPTVTCPHCESQVTYLEVAGQGWALRGCENCGMRTLPFREVPKARAKVAARRRPSREHAPWWAD